VSGALTEEEYAAAIESRRNLSVIISKQEAEAVKVQEKIRDIQKQMETVSGSILKEQQNLDRVYLNVDRGSTPRVPIVPPLQVPGQQ
jgi:serine/threonine protein kinase HipA of HipAB toxin-antitoxin module